MIQTYIKLAYRHFIKNKSYSLINLAGLSLGLLACFLVIAYIQHETEFDTFFTNSDRTYQVNLAVNFGGDAFKTSSTPPPVGQTMYENFPEVSAYTRIYRPGDLVISQNGQFFTEHHALAVDSNFLDFFDFKILEGSAVNCLNNPYSVVLTATLRDKYFTNQKAIGEPLKINNTDYLVTAIVEDIPSQSSIEFDLIVPTAATPNVERFGWSWVWLQMETYIQTQQPLDAAAQLALEAKFPEMARTHAAKAFRRVGQDINEFMTGSNYWILSLKSLPDVHLYSADMSGRMTTLGNIKEVYIFGFVGLMILLLAGINFININTAHSVDRSKEIGVRKVLGSNRRSLIQQFLAETILYCFVAAIIAAVATLIILPQFNQLIGVELQRSDFFTPLMLTTVIGLPVIVGLLAGSYPALVLANFRPAQVLKSKISHLNHGAINLRSGLIVFQFAISVSLIVCTLIVLKQINFALHSDLGLQKENVLVINNVQRLAQAKSFKERLLQFPEATDASLTTDLPAGDFYGGMYTPEPDENTPALAQDLSMGSYLVDDDFVQTMQIELLEGRNFDSKNHNDSATVIVNQAAVKTAGWDNPIGKYITDPGGYNTRYKIIGVMKDFKMFSFRTSVYPFGLFHESSQKYDLGREFLAIKVTPGQEQQLITKAEQLWQSFNVNAPFDYNFLDESFNQMYQAEVRLGNVLSVFTIISIFIACLGLFGLIAYTVRQRTREVGIRRVLGASITNVLTLLTKDLLKLVIVGILVAIPVAWYLMQQWLQDFEYRVAITGHTFLLAGIAAIVIAIGTVGWLSVKAALANPVQALKEE